jgi:hypothetical protein
MGSRTYTSEPPIEGRKFVCRRCSRVYAYPQPGERPIRCECGWWYVNEGGHIREAYHQRLESYRTPKDLYRLFSKS